jgi:hypothetical protein
MFCDAIEFLWAQEISCAQSIDPIGQHVVTCCDHIWSIAFWAKAKHGIHLFALIWK